MTRPKRARRNKYPHHRHGWATATAVKKATRPRPVIRAIRGRVSRLGPAAREPHCRSSTYARLLVKIACQAGYRPPTSRPEDADLGMSRFSLVHDPRKAPPRTLRAVRSGHGFGHLDSGALICLRHQSHLVRPAHASSRLG